jgi:VanZ family protein
LPRRLALASHCPSSPRPEHSVKRLANQWGPVVAWAALIFALSSFPMPSGPSRFGIDKVAHLVEFATLAALLTRALLRSGLTPARAVMWAIALATFYGAVDELHQLFVPGRSSDVFDLAADAAGACAGALGFHALLSRLPRR